MSHSATHPSPAELSAFSLGQLAPDEASVVETHVSECQRCSETMLGLSSDDTFVGLLQEAKQLPPDRQDIPTGNVSRLSDAPEELANHLRYEIEELIGRGGMGSV